MKIIFLVYTFKDLNLAEKLNFFAENMKKKTINFPSLATLHCAV